MLKQPNESESGEWIRELRSNEKRREKGTRDGKKVFHSLKVFFFLSSPVLRLSKSFSPSREGWRQMRVNYEEVLLNHLQALLAVWRSPSAEKRFALLLSHSNGPRSHWERRPTRAHEIKVYLVRTKIDFCIIQLNNINFSIERSELSIKMFSLQPVLKCGRRLPGRAQEKLSTTWPRSFWGLSAINLLGRKFINFARRKSFSSNTFVLRWKKWKIFSLTG